MRKQPKPLTYNKAASIIQDAIYNGTGILREGYRNKYKTAQLAERFWNDTEFTYGIEYGLLIALNLIYGQVDFIKENHD